MVLKKYKIGVILDLVYFSILGKLLKNKNY